MNIGSFVAAVVMACVGFFGLLFHMSPPPQQQETVASFKQQVEANPIQESTSTPTLPVMPDQMPSRLVPPEEVENATTSVPLPAGEAWETTLPLGDYKYTTTDPEKGYVYLCHVQSGGQGAQGTPTWIGGSVWYPNEKVNVEGSVSWPNASYSMTVYDGERTIISNGLPTDHNTGIFPIQKSDPAYQFDANPNSIKTQSYEYVFPVDPTGLATPNCIYGQVGMMDDGVPLFDGFDAEYRDAVAHETQDAWNGHPDQDGVYHDHGFEQGPVKESVSTVVGFAFDGYPITGSLLPSGNYLHTADLDECHGITSTITLDGKQVTTYHYVLTQDFPYSVGCFRGTSYEPKPSGGSGSQQIPQGQIQQGGKPLIPPQAAITACVSKASDATCSFSGGQGTVSGTCQTPPNQYSLVCVPQQQ
jgi:hypothetical protein